MTNFITKITSEQRKATSTFYLQHIWSNSRE